MKAIPKVQYPYNNDNHLDELTRWAEEAEQKIKELEEYAKHKPRCHSMHDCEMPCSCGFDILNKH